MDNDKPASVAELHALHRMLVKSLTTRLEKDTEDDIPTDAATLGVITKLLKDNSVSADPADTENLSELRKKLSEQAARRKSVGNVLAFAQADLKQANGE